MSEAVVDKFKDTERWRRFVDGTSTRVPDEERDRTLAEMGYSSVEEFLAEERKYHALDDLDEKIEEEKRIEKELYGDILKSAQPLEEWADELLPKEFIKADLSIFIRALMAVRHWVFASLTTEQSENIYTALVERMVSDKWSLKDLKEAIQRAEPSIDDIQAETIARSESTLIVNKSREMQFEQSPPGKYGYYWSGPNDHRTTEICKAIKMKTPKKGFDTPDELSRAVVEEARKYYGSKGYNVQVREWLPHPNCRHTIISKMR